MPGGPANRCLTTSGCVETLTDSNFQVRAWAGRQRAGLPEIFNASISPYVLVVAQRMEVSPPHNRTCRCPGRACPLVATSPESIVVEIVGWPRSFEAEPFQIDLGWRRRTVQSHGRQHGVIGSTLDDDVVEQPMG